MSVRGLVLAAVAVGGVGSGAQAAVYRADVVLTEAGAASYPGGTRDETYDYWLEWGLSLGKPKRAKIHIEETEHPALTWVGIYIGSTMIAAWENWDDEISGDEYSVIFGDYWDRWWEYSFSPTKGGSMIYTDEWDDYYIYASAKISNVTLAPIPVPAGAALLPAALVGFGLMRRRKKASTYQNKKLA